MVGHSGDAIFLFSHGDLHVMQLLIKLQYPLPLVLHNRLDEELLGSDSMDS